MSTRILIKIANDGYASSTTSMTQSRSIIHNFQQYRNKDSSKSTNFKLSPDSNLIKDKESSLKIIL